MNSNLGHKSLCDRLERLRQSVTIFESESFCANNFCEFPQLPHIVNFFIGYSVYMIHYFQLK